MGIFRKIGLLSITLLIFGCQGPALIVDSKYSAPFSPYADGRSTLTAARSSIDGLTMVYGFQGLAGDPANVVGPGTAAFLGPLLYAFSGTGTISRLEPGIFFHPGSENLGGSDPFQTRAAYGSDGLLSWGLWIGSGLHIGNHGVVSADGVIEEHMEGFRATISTGTTTEASGGFQYILGVATPPAVLPTSGLLEYRSISDSVEPRGLGNRLGEGWRFNAATLKVLFGGAQASVGARISLMSSSTDTSIEMLTTGGLDNPALSQVKVRPGTATFGGSNIQAEITGFGAGHGVGSIEGVFFGKAAERAGLSYFLQAGIGSSSETLFGTFPMYLAGSSPVESGSGGSGGSGGGGSFTVPLDASAPPLAMVHGGPNGTLVDQSANITALTQNGTTGVVTSYTKTGTDTFVINTAQGLDVGGDALITWGRWANGTPQLLGTGGGAMNQTAIGAEQGFHYVIGKLSPSLPASGTANFSLLGATKPTFTDGSTSFPAGTLASTGAIPMAVEWGGTAFTRVGLDMTVTMPNDGTYRIQTPGGVANPADGANTLTTAGDARFSGFNIPVTITGGGRACNSGTCEATVKGFFSGANGVRAGLNYSVTAVGPPGPPGVIGAAAFVKQ